MYQCQNCGREFEGNFCPACGTARQEALICPNCGGNIEPQAKFCPQCGCPIADAAPASAIGARSSALSRAPLGKTILAFLPATLLLLLSLLLWAFFAAPAVKVNILIASVEENLYHLAGDDFFQKAHATAYALYGAAGCGIAAAIVALLFSGQGRKLPAVLSCLFCIVDLALGIALIAMSTGRASPSAHAPF